MPLAIRMILLVFFTAILPEVVISQNVKLFIPSADSAKFHFFRKKAAKIGLESFSDLSHNYHIRLWCIDQTLDIWTDNFLSFNGSITSYVDTANSYSETEQPVKTFFKKVDIDTELARRIFVLAKEIEVLPTCDSIPGWGVDSTGQHFDVADGYGYGIELCRSGEYKFKGYNNPLSQLPRVKEAKIIRSFFDQIELITDFQKRYQYFISALHTGYYYDGFMGFYVINYADYLYKWRMKIAEGLQLKPVTSNYDSFHFRYWNSEGQIVDIWTNDNKTYNGSLINYAEDYKVKGRRKRTRTYLEKLSIDTLVARQVYEQWILIQNIQSDIWEKDDVANDGISYEIETATPAGNQFKYYIDPRDSETQEAQRIKAFTYTVSVLLNLKSSYRQFYNTLPTPGVYRCGDVLTSIRTKQTNRLAKHEYRKFRRKLKHSVAN